MGYLLVFIGICGIIFLPPLLISRSSFRSPYIPEFLSWLKALSWLAIALVVIMCLAAGVSMIENNGEVIW